MSGSKRTTGGARPLRRLPLIRIAGAADQLRTGFALGALLDGAEGPAVEVTGGQDRQRAVGVLRRDDGDHADAHVERLVHLGAVDAPALGDHPEHGCRRPGAAVHLGRQPVGDHPLEVARQTAAGDVAERADLGLGGQREAVLGVDPGGFEQFLAQRAAELLDVAAPDPSGRSPAAPCAPASTRWSAARWTPSR